MFTGVAVVLTWFVSSFRWVVGVLLLLAFGSATLVCAAESDHEAALIKLKTAYLFNIAKFVHWPQPDSQIRLCIDRNHPLVSIALDLNGRSLGDGRNLVVESMSAPTAECNVYYASGGVPVIQDDAEQQTLMISDEPVGLENGFAIQLFLQRDKLRFAVNNDRIREASYRISSNMLRLARKPG